MRPRRSWRVGEANVSFCVTLVVNRNNGTILPLPQTSLASTCRALRVELYKVQHPRIAYIVNETIQDRYKIAVPWRSRSWIIISRLVFLSNLP